MWVPAVTLDNQFLVKPSPVSRRGSFRLDDAVRTKFTPPPGTQSPERSSVRDTVVAVVHAPVGGDGRTVPDRFWIESWLAVEARQRLVVEFLDGRVHVGGEAANDSLGLPLVADGRDELKQHDATTFMAFQVVEGSDLGDLTDAVFDDQLAEVRRGCFRVERTSGRRVQPYVGRITSARHDL